MRLPLGHDYCTLAVASGAQIPGQENDAVQVIGIRVLTRFGPEQNLHDVHPVGFEMEGQIGRNGRKNKRMERGDGSYEEVTIQC